MTTDTKRIPVCDTSDPAQLEAWYGSFGWADHVRKIVLATCAELIRAEAVAEGPGCPRGASVTWRTRMSFIWSLPSRR